MNNNMDQVIGNPGFEITPPSAPVIIKVVGVGGGGNNAINHMYNQHVEGVSFVVLNTDRQALEESPVPNRLIIGPTVTEGLGAGDEPEVARLAAEESAEDIAALFDDGTKMVFITAGMGGGTGTGAAPVVARIAKDRDLLTIGIVTIPFLFEGQNKILKALKGADEMRKYVDALLIINNERLIEIYSDLDVDNAFSKADETLTNAACSISEMITAPGRINIDFKDVNTTLRKGGVAIISTGYGEGENRVTKAIADALNSPLLKDQNVYSSTRILFNVCYSRTATNKMRAAELNEISKFMANFGSEVKTITGMTVDDSLGDRIKVTILASGFDVSSSPSKPVQPQFKAVTESAPQPANNPPTPQSQPAGATDTDDRNNMERLREIYGDSQIDEKHRQGQRALYIVLDADTVDDDEILDLFESTPTFDRKQEVKRQVDEMKERHRGTASQPVATPAPPQPAKPAGNAKPAQGGAQQSAIDFED